MVDKQSLSKPDRYWERAGERSYAEAMFYSGEVERHVNRRLWKVALDIADQLGVPSSGRVLDLGCGDGAFAIQALAGRYRQIDGYDKGRRGDRACQRHRFRPHDALCGRRSRDLGLHHFASL
jgi:cyclopropane fatty-acyl-phospholipid synthase-like methyltransferase